MQQPSISHMFSAFDKEKSGNCNHSELNSNDSKRGEPFPLDGSSMTSSTASSSSSFYHVYYAKNMLFVDKSPRILTVNVYIIALMLMAFFVVSIYNLSQFLEKQAAIQGRIQVYFYIAQRNLKIRACMLDLKILQAIALEPALLN